LGALGDGTCPPDPHCGYGTPVRVALPRPEGTAFTAIAAAGVGRTAYALRSDGTAWAWGRNYDGESGTGVPHTGKVSPTRVADLTDVVTIGGGLEVGYAATADGRVWAWGTDYWGALGTGTVCADPGTRCRQAVPVRVSGLTGAVAIEGAHGTAFAVQADGSVWAWGRNSVTGDLGNGTTGVCDGIPLSDECRSTVPVRTAIAGVSAVAAGGLGHFAVVRG
jgi:alpha-tubulin suppressor-like RCC1 family protein